MLENLNSCQLGMRVPHSPKNNATMHFMAAAHKSLPLPKTLASTLSHVGDAARRLRKSGGARPLGYAKVLLDLPPLFTRQRALL